MRRYVLRSRSARTYAAMTRRVLIFVFTLAQLYYMVFAVVISATSDHYVIAVLCLAYGTAWVWLAYRTFREMLS